MPSKIIGIELEKLPTASPDLSCFLIDSSESVNPGLPSGFQMSSSSIQQTWWGINRAELLVLQIASGQCSLQTHPDPNLNTIFLLLFQAQVTSSLD
jgi:hypothetical protein